jgi:metallophosphoesterase (TIGR00282 family)
MKILFFGDVVGKIGRRALKKIIPEYKKKYKPDLIMANVENAAHGIGITKKILQELTEAGIDFFTSGNHIFKKSGVEDLLVTKDSVIIRPANYLTKVPGQDYKIVEIGSRSILIVNLMGQVFIKEEFDSPFKKIDEILEEVDQKNLAGIVVDFHAEATSEKVAFGWHVNGKVSAVLGTHTHVPTADAKILPQGTAYITDVGMVGAVDSVIGDKKEPILASFLTEVSHRIEIPEEGEVEVDAVLLEIDPKTKKAKKFSRVDRKIKV